VPYNHLKSNRPVRLFKSSSQRRLAEFDLPLLWAAAGDSPEFRFIVIWLWGNNYSQIIEWLRIGFLVAWELFFFGGLVMFVVVVTRRRSRWINTLLGG
jgi:hypothetical protein